MRERFSESRPIVWVEHARQDVRYAARQMRRSPGFTAVVVLPLALGIGANATMFGVIDRLLLRAPAHVADPDRVFRLYFVDAIGPRVVSGSQSNYPQFVTLRDGATAFERVAAYTFLPMSLGRGADAIETRASLVSASFFPLLGVTPELGRFFAPAEDHLPKGEPVTVLSHAFWQRQFGGDPAVIGRRVELGRDIYTIVGVAPEGFTGVGLDPVDLWVPITSAAGGTFIAVYSNNWADNWASYWLHVVGRVRPGATAAAVEAQATTVLRRSVAQRPHGDTPPTVSLASVIPGRAPDAPREAKVSLWLAGVAALVLLIACANVANLLLGRALHRRREIAVRLSLGASRGRLARQLMTESVLLAAIAGVAALLVALVAGRVVRAGMLPNVTWPSGPIDARVLAATAIIALGVGLLVGLAPVLQSGAPDLTTALRAGPREGGGRRSRARSTLLGAQAALCTLLLIGAGLFVRSLQNVKALDLGVDLDHTLVATLDLQHAGLRRSEIAPLYQSIRERVRAIPGVERVALADGSPYMSGRGTAPWTTGHTQESTWSNREVAYLNAVDSGFFSTVGARSLRGRDFTSADRLGAPRVAVIGEPLARFLWPGDDPLGKCMHMDDAPCVEVVGVLRGVWKFRILERDKMAVYVPLAQDSAARVGAIFVRARGDAQAIVGAVRQVIQGVRGDIPAASVMLMRDVADPQFRPWQLGATMFTALGLLALIIASVGLYSVVAFAVAQRTQEIGIRVALGARARDVLAAVAGDGLRAASVGLAIGAAVALAVSRWIAPLLYQTSPRDPAVFGAVAITLLVVAAVAGLLPTRRALRLDPATVLRAE